MIVKLLTSIQLARVLHLAGSEVELSDDVAAPLIEGGYAVEVTGFEATASSGFDDAQEFFRHLNAKEAIAHIGMVRSVALLGKLAAVEKARGGGPRKSVVEAFQHRATELDELDAPAPNVADSGNQEPSTGSEGDE